MQMRILEIAGLESIREAARMPYQSTTENLDMLAYKVWKTGHRSITRHSIISFLVQDISQDALRQLSRHPHENLTVKSTRYCDFMNTSYFVPEWIENSTLLDKYEKDFHKIMEIYKKWSLIEDAHEEKDTAKLFLPLMSTTDLVLSGNVQAYYEFLQLRVCECASEEIRRMAKTQAQVLGEQPNLIGLIFKDLGCKGKEYGYCPEQNSCGKYPKRVRK